ncbi:ribbon-helix-helix domain-containing protein [Spongisporangium articulatum]|uniref:Ribbon-helix-helix domain-containing protein n=1 Tax=Spongisporangium articulatum TaxID=3362603 RepID=A0ABW8AIZ4_9ACTN
MKLSVSLPADTVGFLDEYARRHGVDSRSAVVQRAVDLLRAEQLAEAYESSWAEWQAEGDDAAWDAVVADGLETAR